MKKLAIITTHPIQYNAPLFRLLSERGVIQVKVFYTWSQSQEGNLFDPGFGKNREWDIPLLQGYSYDFVPNISSRPGSHHFLGVINPGLIDSIISFSPDSILVYGWCFYSHLKTLRYFKGKIPVYFRGDSTLLQESNRFSIKKILRRIALKWVYKFVDKVFYVGIENKKYFLAHGINENNLLFAPHSVDNTRFNNNTSDFDKKAGDWRTRLGISVSDTVFLYAGKLEWQKKIDLLVEAFKQIQDQSLKLVIVGNGPLENEIKRLAETDPRVIFIDFQNQSLMPVVYRIGDVFVLSSISETWGLSVNEAMACGRPAIVSDACGCKADLILEGKTGYSFKVNMVDDLSKKILQLHASINEIDYRNNTIEHISQFDLTNLASLIENEIVFNVKITAES